MASNHHFILFYFIFFWRFLSPLKISHSLFVLLFPRWFQSIRKIPLLLPLHTDDCSNCFCSLNTITFSLFSHFHSFFFHFYFFIYFLYFFFSSIFSLFPCFCIWFFLHLFFVSVLYCIVSLVFRLFISLSIYLLLSLHFFFGIIRIEKNRAEKKWKNNNSNSNKIEENEKPTSNTMNEKEYIYNGFSHYFLSSHLFLFFFFARIHSFTIFLSAWNRSG